MSQQQSSMNNVYRFKFFIILFAKIQIIIHYQLPILNYFVSLHEFYKTNTEKMISFLLSLVALLLGYLFYGRYIAKVFGPDDRVTPAVAKADGLDYIALPN